MPNDFKAVQRQTAQYDLFNRLHSIASDEAFVRSVAEHYGHLDVIANQRCGTWYCDPETSSGAYAYFKSTDGHTGNWGFNMRRSNLPLAVLAEGTGGIILVDSTRRGKRMPDALSKTVPIWCAVINRAVARRHGRKWDGELYSPGKVVSGSERAQIEERLDGWAEVLEPPQIPQDADFTPIICVSASRWVGGEDDVPSVTKLAGRTVGYSYVQGAGDDDELWSKGLTPALFYRHRAKLLNTDRDDLDGVVEDIVSGLEGIAADLEGITVEKNWVVGIPGPSSKLALNIGQPVTPSAPWSASSVHTIHVVPIDKPKKGASAIYRASPSSSVFVCPSARSHPGAYTHALDDLVEHVEDLLDHSRAIQLQPGTSRHLAQVHNLGPEESVELEPYRPNPAEGLDARRTILPLALVLLLSLPDLGGTYDPDATSKVDKGAIADTLHRLVALWPDGNPPRAALKRVNEYLMSRG